MSDDYVTLDGKWLMTQVRASLWNYFMPMIWLYALIRGKRPLPRYK